jgi:ribosomal protein S18 acetylase RimI-like enzyme
MTRDEIRQIADIVGDDHVYAHFVNRINKEFDAADQVQNAKVYVLFEHDEKNNKVGFCVIGHSNNKMKVWDQIFHEEGWVPQDFSITLPSFELMYMYVKPEYRDQGFGQKLFSRALEFTKHSNVNTIYAYVSDRNDTSINFYKKMNAKVIKDLSEEGFSTAFLSWQV